MVFRQRGEVITHVTDRQTYSHTGLRVAWCMGLCWVGAEDALGEN